LATVDPAVRQANSGWWINKVIRSMVWPGHLISRKHCAALVWLVARAITAAPDLPPTQHQRGEDQTSHHRFSPSLGNRGHRLTSDKGDDFAAHQSIAKSLAVNFIWRILMLDGSQGSTRMLNGRIRQYFPKRTSWTDISEKPINRVMKNSE